MRVILATFAVLVGVAYGYKCENLTVPVSLSSRNAVFNLDLPTSEIDVTNFFLELSRQGGNYTERILRGYKTISGDYSLSATYCTPDSGPGAALQVLTHGIGFDRSYWDFPLNNYNYSYVARATDGYGYSTLSWDRLGVGHSSHGEPIGEIQLNLELAALYELTMQSRSGKLCGEGHAYDKVVHVGHSFGSGLTLGLANMYPQATQGIVLTGFSQVPDYVAYFALGGNFAPVKEISALAKQYPRGYIGAKTSIGAHINFFAPGDFDSDVLHQAFKKGQPFTPGEILTLGGAVKSQYQGPVLVITGERDIPFCGGDCYMTKSINETSPNLIEASKPYFPKASSFQATIVPRAGHGLNLAYSHPFTYKSILDFLKKHV